MEIGGHPIVTPLPFTSSLSTDHHVAPYTSRVALSNVPRPAYFRNPWRSYRSPTLNDAWLAYQKGAFIALPPDKAQLISGGVDESVPLTAEPDGPEVPTPDERAPLASSSRSRSYSGQSARSKSIDEEVDDWRDPPVQVVDPRWDEPIEGRGSVTWLGHASVFLRIPWKEVKGKRKEGSCGVLFDPIFSYRCSPTQYVGPARWQPPPCTVADLPSIHVCCISHDHYDHLDYYTIMDIWQHHETTVHFFVPMGLKAWFVASGIPDPRVTEMDWYQESLLSFPFAPSEPIITSSVPPTPALEYPPQDPPAPSVDLDTALTLKIAFTPAQHRSGRGVFDHMTTLWGSWCIGVVEASDADNATQLGMTGWKGLKVFFGGDTGYRYATAPEDDTEAICPAFLEIAALYSPFDLSLLPISTGSSLPFLRTLLSLSLDQYTLTSSHHCSPGDALEIHRILQCRRSLGIHWGTFCDLDEARGTRVTLGQERRDKGVSGKWDDDDEGAEKNGRFVLCDIGESLGLS